MSTFAHRRANNQLSRVLGLALSASAIAASPAAPPDWGAQSSFISVKDRAEAGDPRAQYLLSVLYRSGRGVEQDPDEAFRWCKRAAEEGVLEAQFQLGIMYLKGEGVTEDEGAAMNWLWRAADRGDRQATEVLDYVLGSDFTYGC